MGMGSKVSDRVEMWTKCWGRRWG